MFPIDHIPIAHHDLNSLAHGFQALGFQVSPTCAYLSPSAPAQRWTTRAVFLQAGWLDLQHHPERPTDQGAAPHSCLFRVDNLETAIRSLDSFRIGTPAKLDRYWEGAPEPTLHLAWASVRERIAPLVLALVEAPERQPDVDPRWLTHPNTATALLGLTFGDAQPGPATEAARGHLALSGFRHLSGDEFEDRFGRATGAMSALRIQVARVETAAERLKHAGLIFRMADDAIDVPAQGDLDCGVEFVADPV